MAETYIIYHVPGIKVGCTKNLKRREREYAPLTLEVLEVLHDKTAQEAGDIEWEWADRFGYPRSNHYNQISPEDRAAHGSTGGTVRALRVGPMELYLRGKRMHSENMKNTTPEQRSERSRRAGKAAALAMDLEKKQKIGRDTGLLTLAEGTGIHGLSPEQRIEAARLGGKRANELGLGGFKTQSECPHCGLVSNLSVLKRWHFDHCKRKNRVRI